GRAPTGTLAAADRRVPTGERRGRPALQPGAEPLVRMGSWADLRADLDARWPDAANGGRDAAAAGGGGGKGARGAAATVRGRTAGSGGAPSTGRGGVTRRAPGGRAGTAAGG